jgi:hypothetical protein
LCDSLFTGGHRSHRQPGEGRDDWGPIKGDDRPFDPTPWLAWRKVILFGANHFATRLPVGTTLVWVKRNEPAYGSFLSDAELAWMKGGHGVYLHKDLSCYAAGKRRSHPTMKPVGLMRWAIGKLKLAPRSTVWDPFMGSGSTGLAALELGHDFIGCELDPRYFEAARVRIEAAGIRVVVAASRAA